MKLTIGAAEVELTDKDVARFWSKVDRRGADECWEWKARKDRWGYGCMKIGGRRGKVAITSRIAHAISVSNPSGMIVCHRCDNPACCNPKHLFLGTHKSNAEDREAKGRGRRVSGSAHPWSASYSAEVRA